MGGFHHARPAAGHNHELAIPGRLASLAHQPAEFLRNFIVTALAQYVFGDRQAPLQGLILRIAGKLFA